MGSNMKYPSTLKRIEPAPSSRIIGAENKALNLDVTKAIKESTTGKTYNQPEFTPTKTFSLINVIQALIRNCVPNAKNKDTTCYDELFKNVKLSSCVDENDDNNSRIPYAAIMTNALLSELIKTSPRVITPQDWEEHINKINEKIRELNKVLELKEESKLTEFNINEELVQGLNKNDSEYIKYLTQNLIPFLKLHKKY